MIIKIGQHYCKIINGVGKDAYLILLNMKTITLDQHLITEKVENGKLINLE
jgi:hypothetical protein